jgi:hypothetical protein
MSPSWSWGTPTVPGAPSEFTMPRVRRSNLVECASWSSAHTPGAI